MQALHIRSSSLRAVHAPSLPPSVFYHELELPTPAKHGFKAVPAVLAATNAPVAAECRPFSWACCVCNEAGASSSPEAYPAAKAGGAAGGVVFLCDGELFCSGSTRELDRASGEV